MSLSFYRRILILLLCGLSCRIQAQQTSVANIDGAVLSTTDRTYVSFGQGFGDYKTQYGPKRLTPILFEGQISPDFLLTLSKKKTIGLAFFPKIVVRMFNEPSVPIKTPSYMPSMMFYHRINWHFTKKIFRFFKSEEQLVFITYRISHHSNGQNGSYYLHGGDSINFVNGNFSTNAVEVALSWSSIDSGSVGKAFMNGRIAYERQLDFEREEKLKNTYYYNKLTLECHFIYSEKIKMYLNYGFMWGTRKFGTRQAFDVYFVYKPFHKLSDFSVFLRGYLGPDYYNLYYVNTLRAVTLGIIADPLSIPVFKRQKKKQQQ